VELPEDTVIVTTSDGKSLEVMITNLFGEDATLYFQWTDETSISNCFSDGLSSEASIEGGNLC
jgi:hypothetical protein